MSKKNYYAFILGEEEPKILSKPEYEKKMCEYNEKRKEERKPLIHRGFPTEDEVKKFIAGEWRGKPITEKARTWLEEYKIRDGQLKKDTVFDTSALPIKELPKYCAYVDGSYDRTSETYGFGVVFICDGKIEKF